MKHRIRRIHFVGIGGVGMSGIAEVLVNLGYQVSGTDASDSPTVSRLRGLGARVDIGHSAARVAGADCVVTSSAVRADNPEVREARARRIPVIARATMLAELMKLKRGIAIAGTHGKTTTTSLVASVLSAAGLDPTYVIGGKLMRSGVNARLGTGDLIVVEADESDASFLNLLPMVSVVTNIDADHMDTYGHEMARLKQAFIEFLNRLPFYGAAVLCTDDAHVRDVVPFVSRPIISYGLNEGAMVRAVDVRASGDGMCFTVVRAGEQPLPLRLSLPGLHNVRNALAAVAVADELGAPDSAIVEALAGFNGVGRRFQRHGQMHASDGGRFVLVDDYGHHPTEMRATLEAARGAFPGRRIVLAFQPHRFSRTRDLFDEFVTVLASADALLLAGTYPAGEAPIAGADSAALAQAVAARGTTGFTPRLVEDLSRMADVIRETARDGDVVITMGAGSIGNVPLQIRESAHD